MDAWKNTKAAVALMARIQEERRDLKTQAAIAAELGMSPTHLSRIKMGHAPCERTTMLALRALLAGLHR